MKKLIFPSLLLLLLTGGCTYSCNKNNQDVMQAFNLRMEGKSGQALALLDSLLTSDSTNALAHFERSRVLSYRMLGGGQPNVDEIVRALQKATTYDPTNAVYAYNLAMASFLNAYIGLSRGQEDVAPLVEHACDQFKHVLKMNPDTPEALLQLVEIYGLLPEELGGDSLKALEFRQKLEKTNDYYGLIARLDFSSEEAVVAWTDYLVTHDSTADVLKKIGYSFLYQDNPEHAEEQFRVAMKLDPAHNTLLLDMARYYMYLVMQNRDLADSLLPIAGKYVEEYLASEPFPVIPMQAYALGMLVKIQRFTGRKEEAEANLERAKKLDPWFSRATGLPDPELFLPPDKISIRFSSYFRPF